MKCIVVGEPPSFQPDPRYDDLAPELSVSCRLGRSAAIHSHATVKEEPQAGHNVHYLSDDTEEGAPDSNQGNCSMTAPSRVLGIDGAPNLHEMCCHVDGKL